VRRVEGLAADPRPRGAEKVEGGGGELRLRIGDYRVVYDVDDRARSVVIYKVGDRKEVYRRM
jgi:mRNA interferase RelE/StbE